MLVPLAGLGSRKGGQRSKGIVMCGAVLGACAQARAPAPALPERGGEGRGQPERDTGECMLGLLWARTHTACTARYMHTWEGQGEKADLIVRNTMRLQTSGCKHKNKSIDTESKIS
jgi:hypothetical protein